MVPAQDCLVFSRRANRRAVSVTFAEQVEILEVPTEDILTFEGEERRVDFFDGEARTFQELVAMHKDDYTMRELNEYWDGLPEAEEAEEAEAAVVVPQVRTLATAQALTAVEASDAVNPDVLNYAGHLADGFLVVDVSPDALPGGSEKRGR